MPDINMANRQVCNVLFSEYKSKKPFMDFDTANVTGLQISGDSVYAMAKGSRRIAFQNPAEAAMTLEAQCMPFRAYALVSDGIVDTSALYSEHKTIKCTEAGKITIPEITNGTIQTGTVFVFAKDEFGVGDGIKGSFASGSFTATEASDIAVDTEYEVGYIVNRTGVKKVSFNNKRMPKDYTVTMSTVDKDEDGVLTPFKIIAYKASPQRNFELSFSSEGDPASVTITLDCTEDKDGNLVDMVELTDDAT